MDRLVIDGFARGAVISGATLFARSCLDSLVRIPSKRRRYVDRR
jgi:hypothetical protein